MAEEILINITPQETRVAVVASGVVQELHVERMTGRGLVGNIYLGVVSRVLPGMQSAFIHIGLDRAAFQLPLKAAVEFRRHDTRDGARQFAVASLKQGPVRGPGLGA